MYVCGYRHLAEEFGSGKPKFKVNFKGACLPNPQTTTFQHQMGLLGEQFKDKCRFLQLLKMKITAIRYSNSLFGLFAIMHWKQQSKYMTLKPKS
ncbi:hypothetical protein EVAR_73347_1 [Eumeta japonica]|uniref:Uncharacterized protein n=1 Tax=Eumeta variegata TaxID=151549 RepID=A0A4C1SBD9_EUMVA|nr:hypothetical protein EVAR_73347_1 [Eumeta japonica]